MRSVYGGIILSACTHDGIGKIIPLATSIVSIENEDNWSYFLRNLIKAIPGINSNQVILMHDREKGLSKAQSLIVPNSYELVCVFHLEKNVNFIFKSKFSGYIWNAAKSFTITEFNKYIEKIGKDNIDAKTYLLSSEPKKWARSMSPIPHFGTVTSNSAESLNSWMENFRDKSHFEFLNSWTNEVAKYLFK